MPDIAFRFKPSVNEQITDLERFDGKRWKPVKVKPFESYRFDGSALTRTISKRGKERTETFVDPQGSGTYTPAKTDSLSGLDTDNKASDSRSRKGDGRTSRNSRKALIGNSPIDDLTGLPASTPINPMNPSSGYDDSEYDDDDDDDDDAGYGGWDSRSNGRDDDAVIGYGDDDDDDDGGDRSNDYYRIDVDTNNKVLRVWEYDDGGWEPESIDSNESWSLDNGKLIKRELYRTGTEVTTYAPLETMTDVFTKVSEVFLPLATTTPTSPAPTTMA